MGLLDVITGRRKLAGPAPDRLFAITTANVLFETGMQLRSTGGAALVFQALSSADFHAIVSDAEQLVRATAADAGIEVSRQDDEYGFRWLILRARNRDAFDDLAVGINAVSSSLEAGGYGDRLLCAVFAFEDERGQAVYWIYNYKRGYFYPFVPRGGQQRDSERELVLKAQVGTELPVEPELNRWFALWGIPL
jgi:hypothetical protein